MNEVTPSPELLVPLFLEFHCPRCGKLLNRYGLDFLGTAESHCLRCNDRYIVRVADKKMIVELNFPPVYTPPENSGVHRKRS